MHTLKTILVAVDFSTCSQHALESAATLARQVGATVDILHVHVPVRHVTSSPAAAFAPVELDNQWAETLRATAQRELEDFVAEQRARGIQIANARTIEGDPTARILESVQKGAYDLLVIGTHGRGAIAHLFMGSVAQRVVRRSSIPVLTVREPRASKAA